MRWRAVGLESNSKGMRVHDRPDTAWMSSGTESAGFKHSTVFFHAASLA